MDSFFKDKKFFKTILILALPIALQNMLNALVNIIDSFMVSQLNETAMSSVHIINQYIYIYQIFIIALAGTTGIFISQFFGDNKKEKIPSAVMFSLIIGISIGICAMLFSIFFPEIIFNLFGANEEIASAGKDFIYYVSFSLLPFAISTIIGASMRSINKVIVPLLASIVAILLNIFFNYVLMFGKLGFPVMSLKGAAIGTIISRVVELFIVLIALFYKKSPLISSFKNMFQIKKTYIKKYFKILVPSLLNEIFWVLGFTTFTAVFARMANSQQILSAINITQSVDKLVFVFFIGIGNATSVVIGQLLGNNEKEEAYEFAKKSSKFIIVTGMIVLLLMISFAFLVPIIFTKISMESRLHARNLLIILGFFATFRASTFNYIIGILRTGGDATFCMVVETSTIWLIAVPIAFISALVLHFPVELVYSCIYIEEIIKTAIMKKRFESKKWLKNLSTNI